MSENKPNNPVSDSTSIYKAALWGAGILSGLLGILQSGFSRGSVSIEGNHARVVGVMMILFSAVFLGKFCIKPLYILNPSGACAVLCALISGSLLMSLFHFLSLWIMVAATMIGTGIVMSLLAKKSL